MRPDRDPDTIRPSILLLALAVLLGSVFALWGAASWSSAPRGDGGGALASFSGEGRHRGGGGGDEARRGHRRGAGTTLRDPETERTGAFNVQSVDEDWLDPTEGDDPQLNAMRYTLRALSAGNELEVFTPARRRATLTSVNGDLDLAAGTACSVRVLPVASGGFNCMVQVICGGQLLYPEPNQRAGYVACEIEEGRAIRAADVMHTAVDGDPAVRFDMVEGTVLVSDGGPGVPAFSAQISLGSTLANLDDDAALRLPETSPANPVPHINRIYYAN